MWPGRVWRACQPLTAAGPLSATRHDAGENPVAGGHVGAVELPAARACVGALQRRMRGMALRAYDDTSVVSRSPIRRYPRFVSENNQSERSSPAPTASHICRKHPSKAALARARARTEPPTLGLATDDA